MKGQDVLDAAVGRASLNDAALINPTWAMGFISRRQRRAFLHAAAIDPEYFGKDAVTATRTAYTTPWALDTTPGDVAMPMAAYVYTITGAVTGLAAEAAGVLGTRINLVHSDLPDYDPAPRALVRGRKLVPWNNELGAANANMVTALRVFYAELPAVVTSLNTELRLPDEFGDILILPLARALAVRDQRAEDVAPIDDEYKQAWGEFEEAVALYGSGEARAQALVSPMLRYRRETGLTQQGG